jgi:hypothetical protein
MTVQPEADQPKAETGADQNPIPTEKKTGARQSGIAHYARVEKENKKNSHRNVYAS